MPERVIGFYQPMKDRWDALERVQKIRILAVIAIVLLALIITVFFATRTVWQVAVGGLDPIEANQVSVLMQEHDIRYRQRPDGIWTAIEVDQDRINEARVLVATRGLTPEREFTYEDALSFSGIGSTETVVRANLLRAKQDDLEQAITAMDSVLWTRVELAPQEQNRFFIQGADPSRASVMVSTTRRLTSQEARGIAVFVRNSVLGLELENVEVVDTDFNMLFSGHALEDEDSLLSEFIELSQRDRLRVHEELRNQFRNMYHNVEVASNLRYQQTITEAERLTLGLPVEEMEQGLVLTERTLNASARGQAASFAPGFDSNMQAFPSYPWGVPGDMQATQAEADRVFGVNELREVIREVPNSFDPNLSSVSVALTRFEPHRQESLMRQAQQNGGEFTEDDWLDFQRTTGHQIIQDEAHLAAYIQQVRAATGINDVSVTVWRVPIFYDYEPTPVALNQIIMYAILALLLGLLAFGLVRRTQPEDDDEIEPELSVEDLLVSTQMEEAIEEELLEPIGYAEGSEAKRKIDEFIDDKPEAAASLLRHWLNEAEI